MSAFKYRNYNPVLARWASPDSSGFPNGANNQIYVENSVLNSFDPLGMRTVTWTGDQSSKWIDSTGAGAIIGAVGAGTITLIGTKNMAGSAVMAVIGTIVGGLIGAAVGGDMQITRWTNVAGAPPTPQADPGEYLLFTYVFQSTPLGTESLESNVFAKEYEKFRTVTLWYDFESLE